MKKYKELAEKRMNNLCDEVELHVCAEIARIAKRNNWSFKTVYGCQVRKGDMNTGEELYETELHKLVYWFEDNFRGFGLYVFTNGEWIEGQTPLIQFSKPY